MSDADLRDLFKGLNRAKKYNDELKKKKKQQKQENQIPMTPFSPATIPPPVLWEEPQTPIKVVKKDGYPEWEWMGFTFRPYYAGNLWLNCDASHVYWAYHDHEANEITSVHRLDVKIDTNGKQYVESRVNKVDTKVYLDDALRTVYHTGLPPVQPVPVQIQPTQVNQGMKKPQILCYQDNDYAYYYDGKFSVSRKGGLACWFHLDGDATSRTYDKVIPYKVKVGSDGRKYVSVKQPDNSWKDFDIAIAVATTFLKNPASPNMVVMFKDGNIGNCDADNLYWDMP